MATKDVAKEIEEMSIFSKLSSIDVSAKVKEKKDLSYLPWASAWAEVKKIYPTASYKVIPQILDEFGNTRFWHDDGVSGWVEVEVTINGLTISENLAVMDYRNQALPVEKITSTDANKSVKRCLVKALALHGLGLYIYEGEELPEDVSKLVTLQEEVTAIARKKSSLSDKAKEKSIELCKLAEKEANPDIEEELITGKISNINDTEVLEKLLKKLLVIKK